MKILSVIWESLKDSAKRMAKYYENLNRNVVKNSTFYDVLIGFNGQIFIPEEVNARFQARLQKYFEFAIYDQICWKGENSCLLFMQFRVGAPINSTADVSLLEYRARQVGEAVLMEYMREHRDFTPVDNLVSSYLKGNVLSIIYARTPAGVEYILQSRRPKVSRRQ